MGILTKEQAAELDKELDGGTPRTLNKAIEQALSLAMSQRGADNIRNTFRAVIVDFLNQRFGVAYLKARNSDELAAMEFLYNSIIQEGEDEQRKA